MDGALWSAMLWRYRFAAASRAAPRFWWVLPALALLALARSVDARDSGDPIALQWTEGDVSGLSTILSADGKEVIGYIDYSQRRRGDRLSAVRIAHFKDGSSDEDRAEVIVGKTLRAVSGRTIIRDTKGRTTVDLKFDIPSGRVIASWGLGEERETYDEKVELPEGTYWGPLVFIVIKNFERNATDGRLVFRTVVPTPKPRVLDMELLRKESTQVTRPGGKVEAVHFLMRPTINALVDPVVHMIAPETSFFVAPSKPPSMARFAGPRNYAGQGIRIQ